MRPGRPGSKNIKPDLWKRLGYVPMRKLASLERREKFNMKLRGSKGDGAGSGRSSGSDVRLKSLITRY